MFIIISTYHIISKYINKHGLRKEIMILLHLALID